MFSTTGVLARGLVALQGTEAEQKLASLLYDDNIQVISSLELNQMASFTYHEKSLTGGKDLCEKILDMLEAVLSKPVDHSVLTVQKTLVVFKHLLLYGAEKVINASMYLGAYVEPLQNYNTAVMAQQGSMGMFMRFKGGSVDKGGPVREAAQQLNMLITNRQQLQFERSTKADPNSLVPVGSSKQAGFVTDEARLEVLRRRMEQERVMIAKSNLAKSSSAFGGGYTAKDGKSVVGAAHGLDEMIKQAQKETKKFSDEGYQAPGSQDAAALAALQAEQNIRDLLSMQSGMEANAQAATTSQSVDLLDFGSPAGTTTTANNYQNDLLGTSGWGAPVPSAATTSTANDVFGGLAAPAPAVSNDPFGFAAAPAPTASGLAGLAAPSDPTNNYGMPTVAVPAAVSAPAPSPPQEDRFAALDALAGSAAQPAPTLGGGNAAYNNPTPSPDMARLTDLSGLSISGVPPLQKPSVDTSSLKVSQLGSRPVGNNDEDEDNAFVMGGTTGAGLKSLGPPPAAPPPPPPPGSFY